MDQLESFVAIEASRNGTFNYIYLSEMTRLYSVLLSYKNRVFLSSTPPCLSSTRFSITRIHTCHLFSLRRRIKKRLSEGAHRRRTCIRIFLSCRWNCFSYLFEWCLNGVLLLDFDGICGDGLLKELWKP